MFPAPSHFLPAMAVFIKGEVNSENSLMMSFSANITQKRCKQIVNLLETVFSQRLISTGEYLRQQVGVCGIDLK